MLSGLSLDIPAGQRVLVTGPSGAGKSTLLRALAGLLLTAADGDVAGEVLVDGVAVGNSQERPGLLLQNPTAGIVADTVGRDVAFGLENAGVPAAQIWPRVHESLAEAGFPYSASHPTAALSGGEAQRLALAGSLALGSRVLLLDEPVSMLDPPAAAEVLAALTRHLDSRRPTTVVVDHQIAQWIGLMDRLVVLDLAGTVVADGAPAEIIERQRDSLLSNGVWVPGEPPPAPMEVPAALMRPWHVVGQPELVNAERVGLLLRNRLLRQRSAAVALRDVDCVIEGGRGLAITGPSGAGKSSLVRVLAGLQRPTAGRVVAALPLSARGSREPHRWRSRELAARFAWVPQFPEQGVVAHTVADEVMATNRACGRDDAEGAERAQQLLELLGLQSLRSASPYHLSGGEQRRLMVAAALASGPCVVLSDEPTVGQDRSTWAAVMGAFAAARTAGAGVAITSHDVNAVAALGDERIVLRHGSRVR